LPGIDQGGITGGNRGQNGDGHTHPVQPRPPRPNPVPIEIHEPPTYIRFVGEDDQEITFYSEQRKYVRIETDANSTYHDSINLQRSNINIIVGDYLTLHGTTALKDGRMRAVIECNNNAKVGESGKMRVELRRFGLQTLVSERSYGIIKVPDAKPAARQVTMPLFDLRRVENVDDPLWTQLGWPDDVNSVASQAEMQDGTLIIYYSASFPNYARQLSLFESRELDLGTSFTKRYEIWLTVHSLLKFQDDQRSNHADRQTAENADLIISSKEPELDDAHEREERCRIAVMSAMFAVREVQLDVPKSVLIED